MALNYAKVPDYTDAQKLTYDKNFKKAYPKATLIGTASLRYNCHSYAFYKQSTSNFYWINKPEIYWKDKSYLYVGSSPTAVGQIVNIGNTVHSGVVKNVSSKTIQSKWGPGPLMRHALSYGPTEYKGPYSIKYYKRAS